MKTEKPKKLRVWWIPQVPGTPFRVPVETPEQAAFLLNTLADYDAFQFANNIKPDYSNTGGLEVFEDGEWLDWDNGEGEDIDEIIAHKVTDNPYTKKHWAKVPR